MPHDITAPDIKSTAFHCPHCRALAHQTWSDVFFEGIAKNGVPLFIPDMPDAKEKLKGIEDEQRAEALEWLTKKVAKRPFEQYHQQYKYINYEIENLNLSRCYNCKEFAVWVADRMVWPELQNGPLPNVDLPPDIRSDFEEAGIIVGRSPRGAAALLRLCVQKLCTHLGLPGENLNADIASLVQKGLDPRIQKALDVVRVVGNNAVHPGQIDMKDDQEMAAKLFGVVNVIADAMISQPKHIDALYGSLPTTAIAQIEKRDKPKP